MRCPQCHREIVDQDELEYTSVFGECLSCDGVRLDSDEQPSDFDQQDIETPYMDYGV